MDRPSERFIRRLPLAEDRLWIGHGASLVFCLIALAIRWATDAILPPGYPYLTFFPAVILSAFLFGRGPGIASAILCGLFAWFFFITPYNSFRISAGATLSLAFYAVVVSIDIALVHWMQRANKWLNSERERSRMLVEKSELLFRELQHRISNNLQVVAALLTLQKRDMNDEHGRAAIDEAGRRLALIGKIHRQLYDPSGGRLALSAFLRQLCADLIDAGGKRGIACAIEADDSIALDSDAAIPLALILGEAIANALEHGFADREDGRIEVRLGRDGNSVTLLIADNGRGLPLGFDLAQSKSLGLRIAATLARQLGGTFAVDGRREGGAAARLILPA